MEGVERKDFVGTAPAGPTIEVIIPCSDGSNKEVNDATGVAGGGQGDASVEAATNMLL